MSNILVIDDDSTLLLVLKKHLQKQGYEVAIASNGEEGLKQAEQLRPALIICDWMMPVMDGIEVCSQIKANPQLSTTFFILLTARGEVEDRVKGLDAGADDFLAKPIEINELKARVRAGLRLYQLNQNLQTQKQALEVLNQKLQAELDEAADYVRSLLPAPLSGAIATESLFIPSARLGGDCFDYYWLDDDHLAVYLLDVSGHGVGAALLSVSVLNVLRSQSLPHTNFRQPSAVLHSLNQTFQTISQCEKYFTIWYGVYNRSNRQLVYANAGHPPAILLSKTTANALQVQQLKSTGLPVGFLSEAEFDDEYCDIPENSNLYLFSDGAYEIHQSDGKLWNLNEFINLLIYLSQNNRFKLEYILEEIYLINNDKKLEDDLSLLKIDLS